MFEGLIGIWVDYIYPALMVVVFLGVTILVHELGHFLMARKLGMVVDVFSLGFGPAIWKRRHKGILYKISWFPVGGYVALPQMEPASAERRRKDQEEADMGHAPESLPSVPPHKKILVSLAGAAGNVVLAILIAFFLYYTGQPAMPGEISSAVGYVAEDSEAYARGLRIGDEIVAVNREKVSNWQDVLQACARFKQVTFDVRRRGQEGTQAITLNTDENVLGIQSVDGIDQVGICRVAGIMRGSSAEETGLRIGDTVTEFDGVPLMSTAHLVDLVKSRQDQAVPIVLERHGRLVSKTVTPRYDSELEKAVIGIQFDPRPVDNMITIHVPPGEQLQRDALGIVRFLKALVTPKQAKMAAKGVRGPVSIFVLLWLQIKAGFKIALVFSRFLNVNLAILNLLPIPVLDGGHCLFSLWEIVTRRRLSARVVHGLVNTFAVLVIGLLLFLTYRDLNLWRILWRRPAPAAESQNSNAPPAEVPAPEQ
ncbi:MAG: RIP metalloprotease RseP [Kiritimatiellae bacterium]|nr:RIP metalloprotease RseP [Kiritimatiellia bacterium]